MSVNFRFCGELKALKESEKFKPFETKSFATGWNIDTFVFQGVNGYNKHMFQIKAGYWAGVDGEVDGDRMQIYTVFQEEDESGKKTYSNEQVDYKDRGKAEILKKVPAYKKFTIDRNEPDAERNDDLRREYIYEGDFLKVMRKLIASGNYAGRKFNVSGVVDIQYSAKTDKFYQTYTVQRVSLAKEDAEPKMVISGEFIYEAQSWDDGVYDDGRVAYSVWARVYDRQYKNDACKGWLAAPMTFVFDPAYIVKDEAKRDAATKKLKERMSVVPDGAAYGTIKLEADVIDGAQMEEITIKDLAPEVQEDIELGLTDLETELRKAGKRAFGDRIHEMRIIRANDAKASVFDDADVLSRPQHDEDAAKTSTATKKTKDPDIDHAPFDADPLVDDIFDI